MGSQVCDLVLMGGDYLRFRWRCPGSHKGSAGVICELRAITARKHSTHCIDLALDLIFLTKTM